MLWCWVDAGKDSQRRVKGDAKVINQCLYLPSSFTFMGSFSRRHRCKCRMSQLSIRQHPHWHSPVNSPQWHVLLPWRHNMMAIYLIAWEAQPKRVSHVRRVSFLLANLQFSTVWVFRVSLLKVREARFHRWSTTALSASKLPKSPKRHRAAVQPAWKLLCAAPPATD